MKSKKTLTILVLGILNFVLTLFVLNKFSANVPFYIFKENLVDRMASKDLLLVFPTIILIISLAQVLYRIRTMNRKITTFKLVEDVTFSILVFGTALFQWIMMYIAFMYTKNNIPRVDIPVLNIIIAILGIIVIALASLIQITRKDSYIGIRTKETLADEEVWRKTNRFAGTMGFLAGFSIIASSVATLVYSKSMLCYLVAIVIAAVLVGLFPCLYGKKIFNEKQDKVAE